MNYLRSVYPVPGSGSLTLKAVWTREREAPCTNHVHSPRIGQETKAL